MKELEGVFDLLNSIIPNDAERTVFFCEVENNVYEIFYYTYYINGTCKQCFDLVDEDIIDDSELEKGFEKIAEFIRKTEAYDSNLRNVITISVGKKEKSVQIEKHDKSVGLYKIKKEWKEANL